VAHLYSWDIFCRVIDNLGDIGVCWRLSADLARRGHRVRLWVDDPAPLAWMAPGALQGQWPGVRVLPWEQQRQPTTFAGLEPADVWVEGFGFEPEPEFIAHRFAAARSPAREPVWINLEYLSAETFATRAHGLPSPISSGPARGHTRWFFYPGLGRNSGGLLREEGLLARQARFDRRDWLASQGIHWAGERLVSLFCYEPAALPAMLQQLSQASRPTLLLVAAGRGAAAAREALGLARQPGFGQTVTCRRGALTTLLLPQLSQTAFDHVLWACDLNYVRGEDSFVRALWAGKPLVWQIYPQHDGAHHAKLRAMLDALDAPPTWREYHLAWNGIGEARLPEPDPADWETAVQEARGALLDQSNLGYRLCAFVEHLSWQPGTAQKQS